jgi:hypothetical protein
MSNFGSHFGSHFGSSGSDFGSDFRIDDTDLFLPSLTEEEDESAFVADIEVVDELDFEAIDDAPWVAAPVATREAPTETGGTATSDPFAAFVRIVEVAAAAAGATAGSIAVLSAGLGAKRGDQGDDATPALAGSEQIGAWRAVLRGEDNDLGVCGSLPLDEWAAQLTASAMGDVTRAPAVRRELRARGVAAFGVFTRAA